ncbi:hypothetical protein CLPU_1c00820 [Gottschalkia purinilytica]|uniref:Division initiation protein n=1 Tax=Gottschalkia purinilytica TaxID=1503 RepID=A0A0L0WEL1_GOTPU|nr:DUF881 domain-containing protein [Gottschalkia purinilytica]KNF09917.1 hypothetical protein CLPU_1c00820 [Gottschalkia purinilytica]
MIKQNKKIKISLTLLSILLGILLSLQMKQNIEDYDLVSLNSIEVMKNEVENSRKEIDDLNKLVESKSLELQNVKKALISDDKSIEEVIEKQVNDLKIIGGLEDLTGPGIKVVISDNDNKEILGKDVNQDIIHDGDIQVILNDLKKAGAEAISINGQRVLSRSEIKCGGPIIRINKRSSANPFVITAIGDPKALYAAISAPQSYGWTLKEVYKIKVDTEIKDEVFIPKYYWRDSEFKYVKPIKEGE